VLDGDRRGVVLVVCVLLFLALALLAHGALLMAREELAVSRADADLLRARAAADAGIVDVLSSDSLVPPAALARRGIWSLATGTVGAARYRVGVRRLSREIWLVESDGAVRPNAWSAREARLAWSMDPAARTGAMQGVVGVGPGAPVAGLSNVQVEPPLAFGSLPDPLKCAAWNRVRDSLGVAPVPPRLTVIDTTGGGEPSLGMLGVEDLLAVASRSVSGSGTPGPATDLGGCLEAEPWNWGDPEDPLGACHALTVVIGSAGSLGVDGGVGQGVLVAGGDLTLTGGSRFYGVALVRGRLTVDSGSRLVGLARAVGGVTVAPDSEVDGSGCWAYQALSGVRPFLGRLRVLPGSGRVGPFGDEDR
jgi:hypothetical protein